MTEVEAQATRMWSPGNGASAMVVSDFDRIVIPPNTLMSAAAQENEAGEDMEHDEDAGQDSPASAGANVSRGLHAIRRTNMCSRSGTGRMQPGPPFRQP